jgi:hypothetical protein
MAQQPSASSVHSGGKILIALMGALRPVQRQWKSAAFANNFRIAYKITSTHRHGLSFALRHEIDSASHSL